MDVRNMFTYGEIFGRLNNTEQQEYMAKKARGPEPYYLAIVLPTYDVLYQDPLEDYSNCWRNGEKCYMSFTIFKIVSVTPVKMGRTFFGDPMIKEYPQVILETMDGRRMQAFEEYSYKYGTSMYKNLRLTTAVFQEIERNFVHPRLNMENYVDFAAKTQIDEDIIFFRTSFSFSRTLQQEYGIWKETKEKQYAYFEDYFARKDAETQKYLMEEQRRRQQEEAAKKHYEDAFYKDFGK